MDEYKEIKDMLKPRRDFAASDDLRNRINSTLDSCTRQRKPFRWLWGVGASCVAAAVLTLILIPTGMSAKEILTEALNALINTQGIEMTVEVRTRPMENFSYINLSEDFVPYKISVAKSDTSLTWRIDKGGRAAAGNSNVIYNWIDQLNIGWRADNADPGELLGEMAILLTPEKILESELQNCINNSDAHYDVDKKNGEIILTLHSQPQGNFSNPYMLNASIAESENIRRYVIDADTKHLKSATVSVLNGKRETLVLKITNIAYGQPHTRLLALPSGIKFIDMPHNSLQGLTGLTATEAASAFLNALETWNLSIIDSAIDENIKNGMYEQDLKGSVLLSVGKSFTSGNEGTTFVPYTLRLPNGTQKRHNLALQKSSQGGWIVIGGL
jgi:hypothetical protein